MPRYLVESSEVNEFVTADDETAACVAALELACRQAVQAGDDPPRLGMIMRVVEVVDGVDLVFVLTEKVLDLINQQRKESACPGAAKPPPPAASA